MQINKEPTEKHTIQAYSDSSVKILNVEYNKNLIVGREAIIENWHAHSLQALDDALINPILSLQPEVIIIGHRTKSGFPPIKLLQSLSEQRIGLEHMDIGAACRTFNVLLSEGRAVTLGILF